MNRKTWSVILLGTIFAVAAKTSADLESEGKRWWAHVQYLADDKLEGRDTGSAGFRKAAEYVAGKFEASGLKPAGTSGYFQPIQFSVRQIDEERSSLAIVRDARVVPVKRGEGATRGGRVDVPERVEAPAVFVVYGLSIPEVNHDDLAGLDLRGKVAVFLSGGPAAIPGPLKAHYQSAGERWRALEKAGAIGMAAILNPAAMGMPWARSSLARLNPQMELADASLREINDIKMSCTINPARAEKFFEGSGHTFAEVLEAAKSEKPLPRFPLAVSFRAKVTVKHWQAESPNVVGILPGSDPLLKDEYVVISAHLDHVGVGQAINGDNIYNGAMDNASGVASLLEIARAMRESKMSLKRSVIFLAATAEEKGLLGSKYYAHHPTVNGKNIVANINMDMFLPLFPLKYLEVQGLDESSLGDDIRAVAKSAGVEVQADKEPNANRFISSDQYSFIRAGVPALAFKFGYVRGSPEDKIFHEWYKQRYHAPSDDANQPVDVAASAQFNRILTELAGRVANAPARPQWKPESFFRRFANKQSPG